jgi:hypothetical protein
VRTFHHAEFSAGMLAAHRERTVSVCLPARDEAATIGPILEVLMPLRERGVLDQVVVVDDSTDGAARCRCSPATSSATSTPTPRTSASTSPSG